MRRRHPFVIGYLLRRVGVRRWVGSVPRFGRARLFATRDTINPLTPSCHSGGRAGVACCIFGCVRGLQRRLASSSLRARGRAIWLRLMVRLLSTNLPVQMGEKAFSRPGNSLSVYLVLSFFYNHNIYFQTAFNAIFMEFSPTCQKSCF